MVKLIVLLPSRGGDTPDYYESYNDFLMKLEQLPGIRRKAVSTVYSGRGGRAPFSTVVEVYFDSRRDLETALTSQPGIEAGQVLLSFAPNSISLFADVMEEAVERDGKT